MYHFGDNYGDCAENDGEGVQNGMVEVEMSAVSLSRGYQNSPDIRSVEP